MALGAFLCLTIPFASAFSQWQSFDRSGEDFRALAISDTTIYAFGSPGALHKSTNNGSTWLVAQWQIPLDFTGFCLHVIDGIPVGGTNKGSFLRGRGWSGYYQAVAGVEDDIQAVGSTRRGTLSTWYLGGFGGGVRRSTDAGGTWVICNDGLTDLNVTSLVTVPAPGDSSQVLFAGTYGGGVFRSDDDGKHWATSSSGLVNLHVYALIAHADTLYAAHSGGLVSRSSDAGVTWMQLGTGLPSTDVISLAQVTLNRAQCIYAGTIDAGIWRYIPASGLWEPMNMGVQRLRINAIVARDSILFVATDSGIYRSFDGGSNWQFTSDGATPRVSSIFAASFSMSGPATRLFTVSDEHYYFTEMYSPSGTVSGDIRSAVSWTDDLGRSWTTTPSRPNFISTSFRFKYFAVQHNDHIFLFSTGKGHYDKFRYRLSTDRGGTWGDEVRPRADLSNTSLSGVAFRDAPSGPGFETYITFAYGPCKGLHRSLDSGKTWTGITLPSNGWILDPLVGKDSSIHASCAASALRTTDGCQTWKTITYNGYYPYNVPPPGQASTPMFSLLYANDDWLFARVAQNTVPGEAGGLYASPDHGDTWIPAGFTGQSVDRIIEADGILCALQGGRISASRGSAFLWKDVSGALATDSLVVITASPEYVFALTQASDRIWYRPMSEIRAALDEKPSQPVLLAPADGTTSDSTWMTLQWAPVSYTSSYGIQLSEDPAFSSGMLLDSSYVTDTLCTVRSLVKNHTYY